LVRKYDLSRQIIPKKSDNDPNSIKLIFSWDSRYIIKSKINELIDRQNLPNMYIAMRLNHIHFL